MEWNPDRPIRFMALKEFEDLQKIAGYKFMSEDHAQKFRLRLLTEQAIDRLLEGPNFSTRRVERD